MLISNDQRVETVQFLLYIKCASCFGGYLASNSFKQVVGDILHVDKATSCRVFHSCIHALLQHLAEFIAFPPAEHLANIKCKFYEICQFPSVIGAIDCIHT
uniref:Nuclease HARBI1 n=1 Tax=Romanomermis culicivorax TaxID=13658 RepID=A0A915IGH6_ROMCU